MRSEELLSGCANGTNNGNTVSEFEDLTDAYSELLARCKLDRQVLLLCWPDTQFTSEPCHWVWIGIHEKNVSIDDRLPSFADRIAFLYLSYYCLDLHIVNDPPEVATGLRS